MSIDISNVTWQSVGAGVLAGVVYSLSAWGKQVGVAFEWPKFAATVSWGLVIGVGIGLTGWQPDAILALLTNLGLVPVLENLGKIVWRKIFGIYRPAASKK